MRLLCFPHAGGGPSQFRSWQADALDGLTITPIALPGRESRYADELPGNLEALLQDLLERVEPYLQESFTMIGHSMGALVAFELTRLLRRLRRPQPARLFVSAFRAPHLPERGLALHAMPTHLLSRELARLEGTPTEVLRQPELLQAIMPTLRADLAIVERYRYRPEPPLSCPITCLGGMMDERVSREELRAWREHTCGEFRLRVFPGAHFFVYKAAVLIQRAICADLGLPPGGCPV